MRCVSALFLCLFSFSTWANVASEKLESFSAQVSVFWNALKPACVMTLEPKLQTQVSQRIQYLNQKLIASELMSALVVVAEDASPAWRSPLWAQLKSLETGALSLENRESLREYFFKLQTQTPNPERAQLVNDIQSMSETLNYVLRKELWKTCHALAFSQIPMDQVETAVEQRWAVQDKKVKVQIHRELAAFYFYSFRQTDNQTLSAMAQLASEVEPWVAQTSEYLTEFFSQLRLQLINIPFVINPVEADEPFLEDRPWPPSPSQGLLAP